VEYGGSRNFQLYRRGRYVEFNLVYDRGTHLRSPNKWTHRVNSDVTTPLVRWELSTGTQHAGSRLYETLLKPLRLGQLDSHHAGAVYKSFHTELNMKSIVIEAFKSMDAALIVATAITGTTVSMASSIQTDQ